MRNTIAGSGVYYIATIINATNVHLEKLRYVNYAYSFLVPLVIISYRKATLIIRCEFINEKSEFIKSTGAALFNILDGLFPSEQHEQHEHQTLRDYGRMPKEKRIMSVMITTSIMMQHCFFLIVLEYSIA